ncbi:hypothetical protein ACHHRT_12520 [Desulfurivibrio sp. D14AmB]|uniref:hypothetical protein n=1 Tax=Desulfurivibrio sp. D14AmB TaxID=3374370 RepID=UPI00376EA491
MSDTVLMLIIFGVFAVLIVVGRVTGFLSAPREESLGEKINRAELGDVASPFYSPKSMFKDD